MTVIRIRRHRRASLILAAAIAVLASIRASAPVVGQDSSFAFAVTADIREYAGQGDYDTSDYFRGACQALDTIGPGAFMFSPGDIDPPAGIKWTIEQQMGSDYAWYPAVGNHEASTPADMNWLRSYDYGTVNPGPTGCPETTYSFDHGNAHFAVLNEYCDSAGDAVTDGDVPDHLYDWLATDLAGTDKTHVFVVGHEPAFPQPDADNGRLRHEGDSLPNEAANRDRFWDLLKSEGVLAYICGHTHNFSATRIDGVWQLDAGHARGAGDTGAPSTFLLIHVGDTTVTFDAYRDEHDGVYDYDDIIHNGCLAPQAICQATRIFFPLTTR